jgi:hypothetical protein
MRDDASAKEANNKERRKTVLRSPSLSLKKENKRCDVRNDAFVLCFCRRKEKKHKSFVAQNDATNVRQEHETMLSLARFKHRERFSRTKFFFLPIFNSKRTQLRLIESLLMHREKSQIGQFVMTKLLMIVLKVIF